MFNNKNVAILREKRGWYDILWDASDGKVVNSYVLDNINDRSINSSLLMERLRKFSLEQIENNHFNVSTDYLLTGQNKKDFSQEQMDAFKEEAIKEDTRAMAAHSTNKDVPARGINKDAVGQVLNEYLSTPEGQEHLKKIMGGNAFIIDDEDLQ